MSLGLFTKLMRENDDVTPIYVALADVRELGERASTRDTQENTNYDAVGGYKTFAGGLRDGGEITATLGFDEVAVGQVGLQADFDSDLPRNYELRFPDANKTSVQFAGLVTSLGEAFPLGEQMARKVTIKVSGKPARGVWV